MGEEIRENIIEVIVVEYFFVIIYWKFYGEVFLII